MSDLIHHVSDAEFDSQVLASDTPVLVDFWAEWCGPCRAIAPMLEDLAKDYQGRVKIVKLNIDENQASAVKYNVRSIPTLLLFKNGKVEATEIGAKPKSAFAQMLDRAV
ncbi:MAG TPA: thioredoxin [Rhodanobacteraceae bacterium]|nr:thioredoxin [Rhodanobacteraceae bacterium]